MKYGIADRKYVSRLIPPCGGSDTVPHSGHRGFTLIEVVVVMAIIAVLTGIMVPFIYRIWESTEVDTTRERMTDLKKAMVGDPKLVQNGVRTHFGFVGDNGQLPSTISNPDFGGNYTISNDLLTGAPMLYPNWKGPYMPAGYDVSTYKKDAWGRHFIYTVTTVGSRRVAASLISAGPDGTLGTSDDISDAELQISEREVTPTDTVQGNLHFVFLNSTANPVTPSYSAKVTAAYTGSFGPTTTSGACIALTIGQINAGESKPVVQSVSETLPLKLPTGKSVFNATFYANGACSGSGIASNSMAVFIPDGINAISVNLPTINYTIP
ncbi:MAG: prepilin-type N-terminal cleavage/methylation domain-containing protein [Nitrospirae bacterium]|nr:prepilin-type N-terminal cleavage/methylation domain-containing protein [Nitrospirota bacterium]